MSGLTCFAALPEELHILILSFLDHPQLLLAVSAVNWHLHRLVKDDSLWRALFWRCKHEQTPYEEEAGLSFKELFRQRFVLDRNWHHSLTATSLQSIATEGWQRPRGVPGERPIQAIVAAGGRSPVMAVACAKMHVHVYDLRSGRKMSILPEEDARALALVLDTDRVKDELEERKRLSPGVSRGWGNRELRLVTGNKNLRLWRLPHKKGVAPLTMEVASRIRCMRAVDCTPFLLTGSVNGSVKLWDLERGELVRDLDGFHVGVLCLDVYKSSEPMGEGAQEPVFLAVGGSGDCTAKIWNLKTGDTKILRGHQQAVHRILIDEDIVVAGAMDSTVRTWRLDTGEPLGLFTTHKTVVSHMFICASSLRSLLTICFDGVAAFHPLGDPVHDCPASNHATTRLNIAHSIVDAESDGPYFVAGRKDGMLSLFRLEQDDSEGGMGPQTTIRPIRTIDTSLVPIYQICVFRSGIVVGGLSRHVGLSFLFYDFTLEESAHKI